MSYGENKGKNEVIILFNHKSGVSKTTMLFNLGWILALKGKHKVDADSQYHLTALVLGKKIRVVA